jgi:hypothetical protein
MCRETLSTKALKDGRGDAAEAHPMGLGDMLEAGDVLMPICAAWERRGPDDDARAWWSGSPYCRSPMNPGRQRFAGGGSAQYYRVFRPTSDQLEADRQAGGRPAAW